MRVAEGGGFTVAEIVVALLLLTVGVMALVGSSALMSQMAGVGRHATLAGQAAAARLEWLHWVASSTLPACTGADWRSDSVTGRAVAESWRILDGAGNSRRVQLVVRYRTAGRVSADTISTAVLCG